MNGNEVIRTLGVALLVFGLALALVPAGALAAAEAEDGHGDAGGGIMSINWGLTAWLLVTFLLLMAVLRTFAWGPLMESLVNRENRIREMVEGAERARDEAEAVLTKYRDQLNHAKAEAQSIIEEGRKDASALKENLLAEARDEAERIRDRTTREIELAKDKAMRELHDEVVHLSSSIAGKVLGRTLDERAHRDLINSFIDEYRQAVN